ncbi:MAG TPA: DUF3761 domain-containing protein [Gemmatimonadales bacterium]|nr:DUF3761 domain-containing protein [Gemmatimonadales bacterium]
MNLLVSLLLSAVLATPARPVEFEPDSGSVAFTTASVWLQTSATFTSSTRLVALLPRGAQVRIVGCQKQTCRVEFRRYKGYILRELLRTAPVENPVDPGRGYINSRGQWIPSPAQTIDGQAPDGATARGRDGSYSFSQSRRGTCSWHGGVEDWLSGSGDPALEPEDALALLQTEHHFLVPILLQ